nr:hypothetical protein [Tanacetum cinerariifolium]
KKSVSNGFLSRGWGLCKVVEGLLRLVFRVPRDCFAVRCNHRLRCLAGKPPHGIAAATIVRRNVVAPADAKKPEDSASSLEQLDTIAALRNFFLVPLPYRSLLLEFCLYFVALG